MRFKDNVSSHIEERFHEKQDIVEGCTSLISVGCQDTDRDTKAVLKTESYCTIYETFNSYLVFVV